MDCELSVVMPCLNEVRTLESCIRKAQSFFAKAGVAGEIIVADNGSTDGSQALATRLGVRVVSATKRGYGAALGVGFAAAQGRYIVMGDSDDSYDFSALGAYLERLRAGDDLVVGNRYLGNPMLSRFARLFFRVPLGDVYCGLRGLRRSALERLELQSSGMEFALEMVVKARLLNMRISEVPTTLSPDGRGRPPHLNTWRDGRRSLLLYFSSMPSGLLLYPGVLLMTLGVIGGSILVMTPITVFGVHFDVHTLLYCGAAVLLGFQLFTYSVILRFLMIAAKLIPPQPRFSRRVNSLKIEHGLGVGIALIAAGLAGVVWLLEIWQAERFGNLDPFQTMRIAIPSAIAITLGFQVAFAALFLSLVDWQSRASKEG